jgi:hypothetical protein
MATKTTPQLSPNPRKSYTRAEAGIVLESFQRDTTIESVRLKYGLSGSVLHRWRDDLNQAQAVIAESAFGDKHNPKSRAVRSGYELGPIAVAESFTDPDSPIFNQDLVSRLTKSLLARTLGFSRHSYYYPPKLPSRDQPFLEQIRRIYAEDDDTTRAQEAGQTNWN